MSVSARIGRKNVASWVNWFSLLKTSGSLYCHKYCQMTLRNVRAFSFDSLISSTIRPVSLPMS